MPSDLLLQCRSLRLVALLWRLGTRRLPSALGSIALTSKQTRYRLGFGLACLDTTLLGNTSQSASAVLVEVRFQLGLIGVERTYCADAHRCHDIDMISRRLPARRHTGDTTAHPAPFLTLPTRSLYSAA